MPAASATGRSTSAPTKPSGGIAIRNGIARTHPFFSWADKRASLPTAGLFSFKAICATGGNDLIEGGRFWATGAVFYEQMGRPSNVAGQNNDSSLFVGRGRIAAPCKGSLMKRTMLLSAVFAATLGCSGMAFAQAGGAGGGVGSGAGGALGGTSGAGGVGAATPGLSSPASPGATTGTTGYGTSGSGYNGPSTGGTAPGSVNGTNGLSSTGH